ncbi:MAG: hypothetical protein KA324_13620 [Rubrivivax sp.]|nr:hypothetical protein [Rubrivivax sp.]MBP6504511.1 hypothetical protein [Rhodoferax sp.]
MLIDKLLRFSASQSLASASGTASTDILDLGADRDMTALGRPLYVAVVLEASGGTSPTLQVIVQADDNSGFSSAVALHTGPALAQASNRVQIIPIPHTNERYLRLTYTQGGGSPTATVSAFITDSPQAWVATADGI